MLQNENKIWSKARIWNPPLASAHQGILGDTRCHLCAFVNGDNGGFLQLS